MIAPSKHLNTVLLTFAVFLSAYLSYNLNFFKAAPDEWFTNHQIDSEQLVLDGLLNGSSGDQGVVLGRYSRPDIENQYRLARELYNSNDMSGDFKPYKSQFGLQVKALHTLRRIGVTDIKSFHSIIAGLMSIIVAAMFWFLNRSFSPILAICFASVYIFSPWVVVFARNLYWVSFTWFLPMIVTMALSERVFKNVTLHSTMFVALTVVYTIKLLCGYEYVTTIFLASCVPIVLFGGNIKSRARTILKQLLLNFAALLLGFSLAILVHSSSISASGEPGLSHIVLIAKKRLYDNNPAETARAVCGGDVDCERTLVDSLESNPFKVTAGYFSVPNFIPWISAYQPEQRNIDSLKAFRENITIDNLHRLYKTIGIFGIADAGLYAVFTIVSSFGFIVFIFSVFLLLPLFDRLMKAVIVLSFLAPVSWFFAAKGHSYFHYHMNFVLWYMPFVPISFLAIAGIVNGTWRLPIDRETRPRGGIGKGL